MCRNIKTLHNFEPPATDEEIRASALQFVRKLSGFTRPSKANEAAFGRAVEQVAQVAHELLDALVTSAPPRDREVEAAKARGRQTEQLRHFARREHVGDGLARLGRWDLGRGRADARRFRCARMFDATAAGTEGDVNHFSALRCVRGGRS